MPSDSPAPHSARHPDSSARLLHSVGYLSGARATGLTGVAGNVRDGSHARPMTHGSSMVPAHRGRVAVAILQRRQLELALQRATSVRGRHTARELMRTAILARKPQEVPMIPHSDVFSRLLRHLGPRMHPDMRSAWIIARVSVELGSLVQEENANDSEGARTIAVFSSPRPPQVPLAHYVCRCVCNHACSTWPYCLTMCPHHTQSGFSQRCLPWGDERAGGANSGNSQLACHTRIHSAAV